MTSNSFGGWGGGGGGGHFVFAVGQICRPRRSGNVASLAWRNFFVCLCLYVICFLQHRAVTEEEAWSDVASWRAGCLRKTIL